MHRHLRQVEEVLRARGVRITGPRRRLVEEILGLRGHFTADDLIARMREAKLSASKATVYRTLALLVDAGHLEPREFERGPLRYEVVIGRDHHDHMICTGCGAVHEFVDDEIERLQELACTAVGFRMLGHSHRIFGLCARCVARGRAPQASAPAITAAPPPPRGRRSRPPAPPPSTRRGGRTS